MRLTKSHELEDEYAVKDWLDSLFDHTVLGEVIDGERGPGDFFLIKLSGNWVGPRVGTELGQCTSAELAHQLANAREAVALEILALPPHAFEADPVVTVLANWVHKGAHLDDAEGELCTTPEHEVLAQRGAKHLLRMALRAAVGA